MNDRNYTVYLFKFIFSILIIGIHTNLLIDINDTMNFAVLTLLAV